MISNEAMPGPTTVACTTTISITCIRIQSDNTSSDPLFTATVEYYNVNKAVCAPAATSQQAAVPPAAAIAKYPENTECHQPPCKKVSMLFYVPLQSVQQRLAYDSFVPRTRRQVRLDFCDNLAPSGGDTFGTDALDFRH